MNSDREQLLVRFFGTNSLLFSDGKTHFMIDPYFSRISKAGFFGRISPDKNRIKQSLQNYHIDKLDAVLISHAHIDHMLDASDVVHLTQSHLYGSQSVYHAAQGLGLERERISVIQGDETLNFGAFSIDVFPSVHMPYQVVGERFRLLSGEIHDDFHVPAWFFDMKCGQVFAFRINWEDQRILVLGSAGFPPGGFSNPDFSLAFLSVGGMSLHPRKYQLRWIDLVLQTIQSGKIFLTHWDDFSLPLGLGRNAAIPGHGLFFSFVQKHFEAHPDLSLRVMELEEAIYL